MEDACWKMYNAASGIAVACIKHREWVGGCVWGVHNWEIWRVGDAGQKSSGRLSRDGVMARVG